MTNAVKQTEYQNREKKRDRRIQQNMGRETMRRTKKNKTKTTHRKNKNKSISQDLGDKE